MTKKDIINLISDADTSQWGWIDDVADAIMRRHLHRVTELIEYNNEQVDRRRAMARRLDNLFRATIPFALAASKAITAYAVLQKHTPNLRAAGATKLEHPAAPIAIHFAQDAVSYADWIKLGEAFAVEMQLEQD